MTKTFLMKLMQQSMVLGLVLGALAIPSKAILLGTVDTPAGTTVFPGLTFDAPGTLLASETEPWSFTTTKGTTSGSMTTAVYQEAGGTLDFYYQVSNSATSATSIRAESDVNFDSFEPWTGYRIDGSTLPGGIFVDGTVAPNTADNSSPAGDIGFNYDPVGARILPGEVGNVTVISTTATLYVPGNTELLDGGSVTLNAYQPTAVPEPMSLMLLGSSLLGLGMLVRRQKKA